MKKIALAAATAFCVFGSNMADAQVVFSESFGQTTVRQTSPYMPMASYSWGIPMEFQMKKWWRIIIMLLSHLPISGMPGLYLLGGFGPDPNLWVIPGVAQVIQ